MALPARFKARVTTSAVPAAGRRIDQGGVAAGLSLLGRGISGAEARSEEADRQIEESRVRVSEREQARDRQHAASEAGSRFVATQVELAGRIGELEREAAPGGAGHRQAVEERLSEERARLFSTLPDDEELRDNAREQWDRYAGQQLIRAEQFEASQRAAKSRDDFEAMAVQSDNLVFGNPTPETWRQQAEIENAAIEAMPLTADQKAAIRRERDASRAQALIGGMVDSGQYAAAQAMLDSDVFNATLAYGQKTQLGRIVDNGRDVAQREADMAVDKAREALQEQVDLVEAQIKAGATDVGTATLQGLIVQAKALQFEPADVFAIENMLIEQEVNRRYTNQRDLRVGIAALEGQAREGKLSVTGQVELAHMRTLQEVRAKEAAEEYKQGWAEGGVARQAVVDRLYTLPMDERVRVARALPSSGNLEYALQLRPGAAKIAVAGAEARKANPKLVPSAAADKDRRGRVYAGAIGQSLSQLSEPARMKIMDVALDFYAQMASEQGADSFDEALFRQSIQRVLGREGSGETATGGLGQWNGQAVLLPEGVTQRGFDHDLARHDFAGAVEPPEVVRRKYTPYWVADHPEGGSLYQFRDGSGALLANGNGSAYSVRVWR